MLIATFTGTGTLLLGGKEVVGNGVVRHTSCEDGHEEFVEARHEGYGSEIAGISGRILLMNKNSGGRFPVSRYVFRFKAVFEHTGEDFTFWVEEAEVAVF